MSLSTDADPILRTLIAACTLAGLVFGFLRWVRPRMKQAAADGIAVRDAILGRDAVHDTITGKQIAPALPGIGVRMDTMENAVARLTDYHGRLDDHDRRIKALEGARGASADKAARGLWLSDPYDDQNWVIAPGSDLNYGYPADAEIEWEGDGLGEN